MATAKPKPKKSSHAGRARVGQSAHSEAEGKSVETSKRDAVKTQLKILQAAEQEFAQKGLAGARVDHIAEQADINKRMLYYYFGSKEALYIAVLERVYAQMRTAENQIDLDNLTPLEAIKKLVEFKFDYPREHPHLIKLLGGENMLDAEYLRRCTDLKAANRSVMSRLSGILKAGEADGSLRPGIDPLHLYVTMSGVSYFYVGNAPSLSVAFGRDLMAPKELKRRRAHAIDVILRYVQKL